MKSISKISAFLNRYHIRSLYLLAILYIIVVACISPVFLTVGNWVNLLRQVSVYGILSCGITFIMLCGRIELSAGMMISLLCEISCWFVIPGIDNQFLGVVAPIILGLVLGLVNGVLVGVIKLNSFVATLGTMSIFGGLGLLFYNTADQLFANQANTVYRFIGCGSVLGIPMPVIICILVAIVSSLVLKRTVFGQRVYAVGGNIVNARYSGIKPGLIIMAVYAISGALTGLASVVMTARIMGINTKMGAGYEFTALTAIVLGGLSIKGGKGNIWDSMVGVLIIGILDNSFTLLGIDAYVQYVVEGMILAFAVVVQVLGERKVRKA